MTTFKWQNWVNSTVTASFRSWSRAEIARLGSFWSSVLTREHFELNLFLSWTRLLKQYQFNTTPRCLQGAPALFSERPSLPKGLKGLKTQIALTKRQKLSCYNCVLRQEQCFWINFFFTEHTSHDAASQQARVFRGNSDRKGISPKNVWLSGLG